MGWSETLQYMHLNRKLGKCLPSGLGKCATLPTSVLNKLKRKRERVAVPVQAGVFEPHFYKTTHHLHLASFYRIRIFNIWHPQQGIHLVPKGTLTFPSSLQRLQQPPMWELIVGGRHERPAAWHPSSWGGTNIAITTPVLLGQCLNPIQVQFPPYPENEINTPGMDWRSVPSAVTESQV